MRPCFLIIVLALVLALSAARADTPKLTLTPFDYKGVTLDDGPFRQQFDEAKTFYLRIPNDDLLKGFRARAGKPAPGTDLGGWYSDDVFHIFGQILSGLSRMYAATGDPACREKVHALVRGWAECIEPDGYFFYSRKPNVFHYTYEKMVGGLVDAYHYAGCKEALPALKKITSWAQKNLSRARPYGADGAEWYTLSENLYRAYRATGDTGYRDFAKVWEYTGYWNIYARGGDIHGPRPEGKPWPGYHAYSHVNTLSGAGAAYGVTGEKHYLDTIRNAFDYLQRAQCYAGGGYGPDETLAPRDERRNHTMDTHATWETQCGSWAGFKLCKYLLSYTGEARYGDWVEELAINGLTGGLPNAADGRVFYYSDYNPYSAVKVLHPTGWTCCAGTRPMALADLYDQIYYRAPDGIAVNLFAASTVRWTEQGRGVTVRQRTRFPEEETTEFTVTTSHPVHFALRIRRPGWLAGAPEVRVNGTSWPSSAVPSNAISPKPSSRRDLLLTFGARNAKSRSLRDDGAGDRASEVSDRGWLVIDRMWNNGDRVRLRLPMSIRTVPLDPGRPYPAALMRGPVLMAFCSPHPVDVRHTTPAEFVASPGEPLTYHLTTQPDVLVTPFYRVKEGRPYFVYLDPAAKGRVPHSAVKFTGAWNQGGSFRWGNQAGATAEYTFEGTGIRWLGYRFDDAGKATVEIDGKEVATVDQYGPGRGLPFDWHVEGLPRGRHTIRITILSENNPASKDRFLNVAGFQTTE